MSTVLITGASSGLGLELARLFDRNGDVLVLVVRRRDNLNDEHILHNAHIIEEDLSDPEAPVRIFKVLQKRGLTIDILINNAAIGCHGEFIHADFNTIRNMVQINLISSIHLVRLILPSMEMRNQGQLVNIASLGAFFPGPMMSVYFATKAAMLSFSEAVGFELKNKNIAVTTACPGPFQSGFQQKTFNAKHIHKDLLPSSKDIAAGIFKAIKLRKKMVIPTLNARLVFLASKFLPQRVLLEAVYRYQQ